MRGLKCFRGNLGGIHEGIIAAKTKKEALEIINKSHNCSMRYFNDYLEQTDLIEPAKSVPFKLFLRKYNKFGRQELEEWVEAKTFR